MNFKKYIVILSLTFLFGCESSNEINEQQRPQIINLNSEFVLKQNEIYIDFATNRYSDFIITKDTLTNIIYLQRLRDVEMFNRIAIIPKRK